jgi:hypothetical protein
MLFRNPGSMRGGANGSLLLIVIDPPGRINNQGAYDNGCAHGSRDWKARCLW